MTEAFDKTEKRTTKVKKKSEEKRLVLSTHSERGWRGERSLEEEKKEIFTKISGIVMKKREIETQDRRGEKEEASLVKWLSHQPSKLIL